MLAKGKAAGIESRGVSNHGFIDSISFRDPNGYVVELCARCADHDTAMDPAANGAREKLQRWTAARLGGGWLLRRDQLVQPSISIAATCGNVRAHAPCRGMVSG